jgi:catechol 2,3-dioxygenase-like lactoylglutathione lyase family enzyme
MSTMGAAPPLTVNHVNFPARDPEVLRRWYVDVLGFVRQGDYLWSGGTMLNIVFGTPLGREACWHFGFRVSDRAALDAWTARLREHGVAVDEPEVDGEYATIYVEDPEGNTFEIYVEPGPAPAG